METVTKNNYTKPTKENIKEFVNKHIYGGIIGYDIDPKIKTFFGGKPTLFFDGLNNISAAEDYWKLDAKAFGGSAAQKYVKLDINILGGESYLLLVDSVATYPVLKEYYKKDTPHYLIGFMDLHKKQDGYFVCSGLGIAPEYHGLGLSKYLISLGISMSGAKKLLIPTQKNNIAAINAWKFLGDLETIMEKPFHDEPDTVILKADNLHKLNLNEYF